MENKKIEKLNEQQLEQVAGGQANAKYEVGQVVAFVVLITDRAMSGRVRKTGKILEINGNMYLIRSGFYTYNVEEEDIRTPPKTAETGAHATETGADGGW